MEPYKVLAWYSVWNNFDKSSNQVLHKSSYFMCILLPDNPKQIFVVAIFFMEIPDFSETFSTHNFFNRYSKYLI